MAHFPGFDTGSYPGDNAMSAWKQNSTYVWVGFYLTAPCHTALTFSPWQGHRQTLSDMGWGLAIIYVGFQQEGCGADQLSRSNGTLHGIDAVTKCQSEGFPQGAIIFADVERFDGSMSAEMQDYYRGWIGSILESNFYKPGTYCAASNFNDVFLAAQQEYADHGLPGGGPTIWIVKRTPGFDPLTADPTGCGIPQAELWQGMTDISEQYGSVTLQIDQNTAASADPSKSHILFSGTATH